MLLTVNIGNKETSIGLFNDGKLAFSGKISTVNKSVDELAIAIKSIIELNGYHTGCFSSVILSSVVPQLTGNVKDAIGLLSRAEVTEVAPGIKTGFSIKIDDPSQLGADIVANTSGAIGLYGYPVVVIDLGNSTTVFAVNSKKELVGGCILPGVNAAFDSLRLSTAQLPNISTKSPRNAIGKNTADSMRSGVVFGTAMAIDGFIERFKVELGIDHSEKIRIVATGIFASSILPCCKNAIEYEKDLTLKGLCNIMELNSQKSKGRL